MGLQCFIVSTVNALQTPMINAGMVSLDLSLFLINNIRHVIKPMIIDPQRRILHICLCQVLCDRHYGGINYPIGGVGGIAKSLAKGLVDQGSEILYKANVTDIIIDQGRAVSSTLLLDKQC